jgi:predicted Rossmann-fold nucleotide-binding protein
MESYLSSSHFDLVTPDGFIHKINFINHKKATVEVHIHSISEAFRGFYLDPSFIQFNLKSTLAQLGLTSSLTTLSLNSKKRCAELEIDLIAVDPLGEKFLPLLSTGAYIGKLFAEDISRKVRDPIYLTRMFGRQDRNGKPLLSLGSSTKKNDLWLEKINGYTVAFIRLKKGNVTYDKSIFQFLPTLAKMLHHKHLSARSLLFLHQKWNEGETTSVKKQSMLLVRTPPLYIRTVFAKVVNELLPSGAIHTSASILQPDTANSGDIYEFYGKTTEEIEEIPLEFYTLEPHREYIFFSDRDQLQNFLEKPQNLEKAFKTAPKPKDTPKAVFVVKGSQMAALKDQDWIIREAIKKKLPGMHNPEKQAALIKEYMEKQASFPFLKAMEDNLITSQGVLLSRYFPSPLMKRLFIAENVQSLIKGIYFQIPSRSHGNFFSHEDRSFLIDLYKFAIPVYWVDAETKKILQYVVKPNKDTGMFVPLHQVEEFRKATFFGVYGSTLIKGPFEKELYHMMKGIQEMKQHKHHPLMNPQTPLALVTGGGPGAMKMGNEVARKLKILSCANLVDFEATSNNRLTVKQPPNPYIDAKMTYRLDQLIERQAEFYLDFPIFVQGGIGMDFEFTLEEVRRKVGASNPTPIMLFGSPSYWKAKITGRFQCNRKTKTTKGSEWVSNCFYCIENAKEGLWLYEKFFDGTLAIGPQGPIYSDGFAIAKKIMV